MIKRLTTLTLLLAPGSSLAAEAASGTSATAVLLRGGAALALVLGLLLLAAGLTRRLRRIGGARRHLQALEQMPLARGQFLARVRYHDRELLLGVCDGGISLLEDHPLSETQGAAEMPDEMASRAFLQRLRSQHRRSQK